MPIEFTCDGCGKKYRLRDELAGRRAKCKVCGAMLVVPTPEPAQAFAAEPPPLVAPAEEEYNLAPPPLPAFAPLPPPVPAQAVFPTRYAPPPGEQKSHTGIIITLVVVLAVLAGIGGLVALVMHTSPALFTSDDALKTQLVGTWTLTRSPNVFSKISVTYKDDGTFMFRTDKIKSGLGVGGTYGVSNHIITLTMDHVENGRPINPPKVVPLGRIREITSTRLVMQADSGEETYSRP